MANFRLNQTEFFESIQTQQAAFGQNLHELKMKQHDILHNQSQFFRDVKATLKLRMYTSWGLQQGIPGLAPIPATDIATRIKNNVKANKGMFDGITRHWPIGESSKEKAPIEKDTFRDPNANSDDE
ncbi:hypothetical protein PIB30_052145 [Stylosanthes scabra]|uniref:Uncharacterized protein n=1 Tax=Stylosanthes scabra TaxID=79078 RepID=A0ABU6YIK4_9FABA|nr:hypothetical protein [Stylosanthes scabra]